METIDEVSNRGLAAIYNVLLSYSPEGLADCCDELGVEQLLVQKFARQYKEQPLTYYDEHLQLARWFVLRATSRDRSSAAEFEALVREELVSLEADDDLVFPCWLLAKPVPQPLIAGRLPARPLGGGFDDTMTVAHDGLLGYLSQWSVLKKLPHRELALSSTIWRVVGIIEEIAGTRGYGDDLHHQIAWMQAHLMQLSSLSQIEKELGRSLRSDLSRWRNALTHINRDDGDGRWTFLRAVERSLESEDEIEEIASAVNLAVLDHLAHELRDMPFPRGILDRVERELSWID